MDAGATIRAGRYVVVGTLGSGAQAETLDCVDKLRGTGVAIKRFSVRGAQSWKDVELAEREASVLASLDHAALPKYVEHFEEDGALYLVMERIDGPSLATIRAEKKGKAAMGEREILRLLIELGEVFEYLHGRAPAVIHRDVKPGNILRRPDGSFALVDFGAVRDKLKPQGGSTVVGTFGYMAPEQFQGRALPSSDVYALGATALAMLTGRDPEDLPHKGLGIDVDAALAESRDRTELSRALARALKLMVEPDPDKRPASVKSVLERAAVTAAVRGATQEEARKQAPPQRARATDPREIFEEVRPPGPGASRREWREWKRLVKERARERVQRLVEERQYDAIEARRAAKEARRRWKSRSHRPRAIRGVALLAVTLAFTAAQLVVMSTMVFGVPVLLMMLSAIFGQRLRDVARLVSNEGHRVIQEIGASRAKLWRGGDPAIEAGDEPLRVRVVQAGADQDRASTDLDAATAAAHEQALREEADAARRRSG